MGGFYNTVSAPISGVYEINMRSTDDRYIPEKDTKTITYDDGIDNIDFNIILAPIKEPGESSIELRTSPSKISDSVIIHYRYKENEDSEFDEWIELTD